MRESSAFLAAASSLNESTTRVSVYVEALLLQVPESSEKAAATTDLRKAVGEMVSASITLARGAESRSYPYDAEKDKEWTPPPCACAACRLARTVTEAAAPRPPEDTALPFQQRDRVEFRHHNDAIWRSGTIIRGNVDGSMFDVLSTGGNRFTVSADNIRKAPVQTPEHAEHGVEVAEPAVANEPL